MADLSARLSLRAFARLLGVSDYAVRKAVASGRLVASVLGRDDKDRVVIRDVEGAKRAWTENASKPPKGGTKTQALSDVQVGVGLERQRKLRHENDLREGRSIDANQAAKDGFESARTVRENVLNVTARVIPVLAAETDQAKMAEILDAELRQALNAAADALAS